MGRNSQLGFKLTERIEGVKRSMNRVMYETMAAMVVRMDEKSPVATPQLWKKPNYAYKPGQFRGNWQLGVNVKPVGWFPGKIDPTGVETVAQNLGRIPAMASRGYKFYLYNNTPYGKFLESGSVTMKMYPAHFIRGVKAEYKQIVRSICEQVKSEGGRVK